MSRRLGTALGAAALLCAACSAGRSVPAPTTTVPATTGSVTTSSSAATTTTAPTTTTAATTTTVPPPTTFAILGDYGDGGPNEPLAAGMIHDWDPDYIVTTGDNAYGSTPYDEAVGRWYSDYIGGYEGSYGAGSAVNRFFPSLGNHDFTDAGLENYLAYFDLPGAGYRSTSGNERYYDVVLGPVHWFIVDSHRAEPDGITADSTQAAWLYDGLVASTSPWNVVVFHHAPYGSVYHKGDEVMRWPFAAWGADLVINGHNHDYERFSVDGITYVTVGLGYTNVPLGANQPDPHSVFFFGDADTGALLITACDDALLGEFATVGLGVIDSFAIGAGDCA
jgi:tartrate-resistant acid phosphatase type 5